ncbi:Ferrous iron transport protein B [Klebsiella michiganensis]|uniref:Ferrous iron transport protein B n=1 Tax=Klebsiella michiganensis TaxID=1134687 RepID=A0A7H4M4E3_9ENTR|nr:Ferrous iron transport protein B [Klebsiella michiganensis]
MTVERKEGGFNTTDHQVTLVDLPGTYSLTTISSQTSLDEQIACHYILSGDADMLINVVDASNLERNLYLTLQLLELGIPCVVALNMLDIAEKTEDPHRCRRAGRASRVPGDPAGFHPRARYRGLKNGDRSPSAEPGY